MFCFCCIHWAVWASTRPPVPQTHPMCVQEWLSAIPTWWQWCACVCGRAYACECVQWSWGRFALHYGVSVPILYWLHSVEGPHIFVGLGIICLSSDLLPLSSKCDGSEQRASEPNVDPKRSIFFSYSLLGRWYWILRSKNFLGLNNWKLGVVFSRGGGGLQTKLVLFHTWIQTRCPSPSPPGTALGSKGKGGPYAH